MKIHNHSSGMIYVSSQAGDVGPMTKEMAEEARASNGEIHYTGQSPCTRDFGPKTYVMDRVTKVRPNGKAQTWKTRPNDFRLPVKYGLKEYLYIDQDNAAHFHRAEDCPLHQAPKTRQEALELLKGEGLVTYSVREEGLPS